MAKPVSKGVGVWVALGVGVLFWAVVGATYVYCVEPQWVFQERRLFAAPAAVEVLYTARKKINETTYRCAQFYALDLKLVENGRMVSYQSHPLRLAFAHDMLSPEDTEYGVDGTVFLMNGYLYQPSERNVLTGETRAPWDLDTRFDVVSWTVKAPNAVVGGDNSDREHHVRPDHNEPTRFAMSSTDHSPSRFTIRKPLCIPDSGKAFLSFGCR